MNTYSVEYSYLGATGTVYFNVFRTHAKGKYKIGQSFNNGEFTAKQAHDFVREIIAGEGQYIVVPHTVQEIKFH